MDGNSHLSKRASEGRARAKAESVKFGARPKLTAELLVALQTEFVTPGTSKRVIAARIGISRSTAYLFFTLLGRKTGEGESVCYIYYKEQESVTNGGVFSYRYNMSHEPAAMKIKGKWGGMSG
jgi:hypothetical protein